MLKHTLAATAAITTAATLSAGIPSSSAQSAPKTLPGPPGPALGELTVAKIVDYAHAVEMGHVADYVHAVQMADVTTYVEAVIASETPPPVVWSPPYRPVAPQWTSDGLGACGGSLPPCYVKQRESGGDYSAQNPTSSASGAWQFLDSTWNGYGGYSRAADAPPAVQDEKAALLWAGGAGCSHWSAC